MEFIKQGTTKSLTTRAPSPEYEPSPQASCLPRSTAIGFPPFSIRGLGLASCSLVLQRTQAPNWSSCGSCGTSLPMELQIPRPENGASENRGNTILTLAKASIYVDIYSTVMRSSFPDNGHWRFGMGIASLSKRASLSLSPDRSS